jgi:hypothetical protein
MMGIPLGRLQLQKYGSQGHQATEDRDDFQNLGAHSLILTKIVKFVNVKAV